MTMIPNESLAVAMDNNTRFLMKTYLVISFPALEVVTWTLVVGLISPEMAGQEHSEQDLGQIKMSK